MDLEQIERATTIIEQANVSLKQLEAISRVVLLYNQGANAESCMERIRNILMGDSNV